MAACNQFIFEALIKVELPDQPLDYLELNNVIHITLSAVQNHEKLLQQIRGVSFSKGHFSWVWEANSSKGTPPLAMPTLNKMLTQIVQELGYVDLHSVSLFHPNTLLVRERHCFQKI